jgi:hypothetical protein
MKRICLNSFEFTDVGNNWQASGISNVNIQFVTIGSIIGISNVFFPELYIGFPKNSPLVGGYLTNNNARYEAEGVFTQAEQLTDLYQSANPTSTAQQLRDYFYLKLTELCQEKGGAVSTSPPLGWTGTLKEHTVYFLFESLECD